MKNLFLLKVISGNVILRVDKLNYTYEFYIDIINGITINLNENIKYNYGEDMIITNDLISKNKNIISKRLMRPI